MAVSVLTSEKKAVVEGIQRQIIALGGGGFSTESNQIADSYILSAAKVRCPRICFLATASGDTESYIARFYSSFSQFECKPTHISLFRNNILDLNKHIQEQDIIYVGGGNTKSMLAVWREWGVDQALKQAYMQGVVLAGTSAGAICWFEWGLTDSFHGEYRPLEGLGLIPGSVCPHFSNESGRDFIFDQCIQQGEIPAGYGIDNGGMLHFLNESLDGVYSSSPLSRIYFCDSGKERSSMLSKSLENFD